MDVIEQLKKQEEGEASSVDEKEVNAVSEALRSRFSEALKAGRLSQVSLSLWSMFWFPLKMTQVSPA